MSVTIIALNTNDLLSYHVVLLNLEMASFFVLFKCFLIVHLFTERT